MNLTKHFQISEFERSETASKHSIKNKIPEKYLQNIFSLANLLEIIREIYGKPIIINSGYRCPELNRLVGGSVNSQHLTGSAADIRTKSNTKSDNKELFELIVGLQKSNKIEFRSLINEKDFSWIHIAVQDDEHSVKHNEILAIK